MKNLGIWIKISLFNFLIVSVLGVMMRYNLAFSLPGFSQKFMQESHSHFAFYGWVSACIYLFVADFLKGRHPDISLRKYRILMVFNQVGSFGMLFSFLYGGYYWLSIAFSAVVLFAGFAYFLFLVKDTKGESDFSVKWLRTGAFFATFSAIGIFGLAYLSSRKEEFAELYRASTYFYLHYQYNGFFLFSCIGILLFTLKKYGIQIPAKQNRIVFIGLCIGTFLGYGLSVLWMDCMKNWFLPFLVVALIQLYAAWKLWLILKSRWKEIKKNFRQVQNFILQIVGISFLLKFLCQFISAVPGFQEYAFGNLNIIIGYLHLVLLVGISLFLIWKILDYQSKLNRLGKISLYTLVFGIVLNEFILAFTALFPGFIVPFSVIAFGLLVASVVIMVSILFFLASFGIAEKPVA